MDEHETLLRLQYMYDSKNPFMVGKRVEIENAMKAIKTLEKIKNIIREEEHYEVSNSIDNPHPNQADYDAVHADKFNRIWKVVSDMESKDAEQKYTD